MSGSLTSRHVLAAKVEDTPGTLDTGVYSATHAKHQIIDANMVFDFPTVQRGVKRSTLTPVQGIAGRRTARCTFTLEETGHSSSSVPTWDKFVRACGMSRRTLYKVTIGAITGGPFRHGETITQTGTSATAKVFMDTFTGTTTLYVHDVRGNENNSGVWTGGTSAATATPSTNANAAAGYGWEPADIDTLLVSVTSTSGTVAVGETALGGTSGANGVVESIETYTLTVSGVAGTVALNDIATGGTSSAVAVVDEIVSTTVFRVRVRGATLFSGAETITFTGSGATATHTSTRAGQIAIRVRNALVYTGSETITFSGASTATHASNTQQDMPTLTIASYEDGKRKVGIGMRGTFSLDGSVGNPMRFRFDFQGAYGAVADVSQLSGITYEDKVPPVLLSANTELRTEGTAGSYAARFSSVTLGLGNRLEPRDDASASSGIREFMIAGRAGSGSVDPEADLESSYPMVANFRDSVACSLKFTNGTALGNQFVHQVPGLSITGVNVGDRNGIRTEELAFSMTGGSMANASDSPNERNDLLIAYITA